MSKTIDLKKTVLQLCEENPELKGIMAELGFEQVLSPAMLNTVGRIMTIPKGALMKEIDLGKIVSVLEEKGYTVLN